MSQTPKVAAYIIHLERAVERRDQVQAIVRSIPFETHIVPAVDGRASSKQIFEQSYLRNLLTPRYPFALKAGEIGCFLSHRRCWQKIIDDGLDGALIIEDDVEIAAMRLRSALALIQSMDASAAYIRFPNKIAREKGILVSSHDGISLIEPETPGLGTVGQYVGREAAKRLLEVTRKFDRPIDSFLQLKRAHYVRILSVLPGIMRDDSATIGQSHIQGFRGSLVEKLHREVMRPVYRLKVRWANRVS
jgi:GR25 family glycosyltransferase involved in LPS biosynthesis